MIENVLIFVVALAIGVCCVKLYQRRALLRSWWRSR
jgi:hypothetical protein